MSEDYTAAMGALILPCSRCPGLIQQHPWWYMKYGIICPRCVWKARYGRK